jgi:transcriptional regulator with XRE-family HTH domain
MKYKSTIADVINSLVTARKSKKLNQSELGRRLRMPQSYVSRLESSQLDIRLSSLIGLARYLNLEIMLIPTALVPTVKSLISSGPAEKSDSPLYSLDDDDFGAGEFHEG